MFSALAKRVFGSANDRFIKGLGKSVQAINALEPELKKLTDAELAGRTAILQGRLEKGETLDDMECSRGYLRLRIAQSAVHRTSAGFPCAVKEVKRRTCLRSATNHEQPHSYQLVHGCRWTRSGI
jgi:hypothetical protein